MTIELSDREVELLIVAVSHGLDAAMVPEADRAGVRGILRKLHAAKVDAEQTKEGPRDLGTDE